MEFGERIFFRPAITRQEAKRRGSFAMKMEEGRYLGHHGRTGSILVITEAGVRRATAAKRMTEDQRWKKDGWDRLRGLPWEVQARQFPKRNLTSGSDAVGTELPVTLMSILPPQERRMYVTKADVEKFGAS